MEILHFLEPDTVHYTTYFSTGHSKEYHKITETIGQLHFRVAQVVSLGLQGFWVQGVKQGLA
jgi:hypothetical protein